VLLLHGFPDSWHLWRHQIAALAGAGYHVIAPDLRGFGGSDKPAEVQAYSMTRALLGDVVGLLDALDVQRAAIVGHDFGAALAWVAAMLVPDRVRRLVVVSVGHPVAFADAGLRQKQLSWYMLWFQFQGVAEQVLPRDDWAFFRRWAWGGARPGEDADADRQVADLARPGALTAGLNWYRANIRPSTFVGGGSGANRFPPVACPTMGVWSSDDMALTEEQMIGSARFVTGPWRYERIDGVDHWVPVHAADELNRLLLDFLGEADPAPASRRPSRA
jgi:pimeloyl-ACP methyl ester carboxylesterase